MKIRPHTATLASANETHDDRGVRTGTEFLGSRDILCQITPERTNNVKEAYGIDVKRPYLMLMNVEDARDAATGQETIKIGDRLSWGLKTLFVKTAPEIFECGNEADNASVILEEVQYLKPGAVQNAG